jgi:hypothetical protein
MAGGDPLLGKLCIKNAIKWILHPATIIVIGPLGCFFNFRLHFFVSLAFTPTQFWDYSLP